MDMSDYAHALIMLWHISVPVSPWGFPQPILPPGFNQVSVASLPEAGQVYHLVSTYLSYNMSIYDETLFFCAAKNKPIICILSQKTSNKTQVILQGHEWMVLFEVELSLLYTTCISK